MHSSWKSLLHFVGVSQLTQERPSPVVWFLLSSGQYPVDLHQYQTYRLDFLEDGNSPLLPHISHFLHWDRSLYG